MDVSGKFQVAAFLGNDTLRSDSSCLNTQFCAMLNFNVGIDKLSEANAVSLFPNPSNGRAYLKMNRELTGPVLITITDLSGKVLQSIHRENLSTSEYIPLPAAAQKFPPGMYIVSVNNQLRFWNLKMVVQ